MMYMFKNDGYLSNHTVLGQEKLLYSARFSQTDKWNKEVIVHYKNKGLQVGITNYDSFKP